MPDPLVQAHDTWVLQLEKADPRVEYRMADASAEQRCGNCRYYGAADMSCNLVEGSINSSCTCDLWTVRMSGDGMMWSEGDRRFQVFVEVPKGFGDLNPWIPFLPKPGKFQHPLYGEIEITVESNQGFVDSIQNHVYQDHIPIDAEHETKLSGAVAWIQGMRLNEDGSADAYVEWTDRGKALIEGGGFKYISPEWYDEWQDPATQVVHYNVIAGGAITTRPFFKELSLRALVASEKGVTIIAKEERTVPENKAPEAPKTYADGSPELTALIDAAKTEATAGLFTEEQVNAKIEEAKKAAEPDPAKTGDETPKEFKDSKEFIEMNTRLQAAEEANKNLTTSLTAVQNRERRQRFTDLVAGRGGANDGGPWVGEAEKHVSFLEKLADQVGEDNEMFSEFVQSQNAIAAQSKMSELFAEAGTSAPSGAGSDADSRLEAMTQARMKAAEATGTKLTHAKAYNEILATPEGAQIYQAGEIAKAAKRA